MDTRKKLMVREGIIVVIGALMRFNYPTGASAHAYRALVATIEQEEDSPQTLASSPVQLTVGTATRLLLTVSRDFNSTRHVFNLRLLNDGSGVNGKTIKIKLNQTEYPCPQTDQTGWTQKVLWLSPQANNNQTKFNVVASFEGDETSTAKASMSLPNGTIYDVCTTIQYNTYKPSSNSTAITVMPQTTTGATTLMNQEQMQKDAESKGWFTIDPEFSWSYPWVRLHLKLNMDLPQGNRAVDYGWSPLPYGTSCTANFAVLNEVLNEFSVDIESHILLSLVFSFAIRTGIYLFMGATGFALGIAIALYWAYAIIDGLIFYLTSSNNPKAWLATFITQLWSLGAGVVEGMFAAGRFLTAVSRWILGQVSHVMNSMWAMRLNFFNISGILFTIFDFLIMVAYLGAYFLTVG